MILIKKKRSILLSILTILMINACSSYNDIVSTSEIHLYNNEYGIVLDEYSDRALEKENFTIKNQIVSFDTEQLYLEPGTFYAEDYIQIPEIITYKYKFDSKFYSYAEWRAIP